MVRVERQDDVTVMPLCVSPPLPAALSGKSCRCSIALCLLVSSDANCRAPSFLAVLELKGFFILENRRE